jgi:nucleotide-binding universal stress UspA family protein
VAVNHHQLARQTAAPRRVLVPLDASPASTRAVEPVVERLHAAGLQIISLHVFDKDHVPCFMDHMPDAYEIWRAEFLARYCPNFGARLLTRIGKVPAAVLQAALDEGADMILLSWGQKLSRTHGRVVRDVLNQASVPVVVIPVEPSASREVLEPSG